LEKQLFNRLATKGVGSKIRVELGQVVSGVPHGSVLGPILFVYICVFVFINDLLDTISSFIYIYADDTKMSRLVNVQSEWKALQHDLKSLQEWSDKWQLKCYRTKCTWEKVTEGINTI